MFRFTILALLLIILSTTNGSAGTLLSANEGSVISEKAIFRSQPHLSNVDGLKIDIVSPIIEDGITLDIELNKYYVYSNYPAKQVKRYLGLMGTVISFTNETQNVVIISWKDSIVSVDKKVYGIPYLENMPYRDAGNPSATPNTIIPPGNTATVRVWLPDIAYNELGEFWQKYPIPIPRVGSVAPLSYYLNITVRGKTSYITLETPEVYIPDTSSLVKNK